MNVFLDAEQVCTISEPRNAHEIRQHMANRLVLLMNRVKEIHADDGQLLLRTTVAEICHGVCRTSCFYMSHHYGSSILSLSTVMVHARPSQGREASDVSSLLCHTEAIAEATVHHSWSC